MSPYRLSSASRTRLTGGAPHRPIVSLWSVLSIIGSRPFFTFNSYPPSLTRPPPGHTHMGVLAPLFILLTRLGYVQLYSGTKTRSGGRRGRLRTLKRMTAVVILAATIRVLHLVAATLHPWPKLPDYSSSWELENTLPQHNLDLPWPEGRDGYVSASACDLPSHR